MKVPCESIFPRLERDGNAKNQSACMSIDFHIVRTIYHTEAENGNRLSENAILATCLSVRKKMNLLLFSAPPILLVKPSDTKVKKGSKARLVCIAAGNPAPTLFWMKEGGTGILLPGHSQERVTVDERGTMNIGKEKMVYSSY